MNFDDDDFKELDNFARQFFGMSFRELIEKLHTDFARLFGEGNFDFSEKSIADIFKMFGQIDPESLPNVKSFRFVMKDGKPYFEMGSKPFNPFGTGMEPFQQPATTEKVNPDGTIEPYTETSIMEGQTVVVAELPGVEKDGIQIKLKNEGLFIKGRATTNDVVYVKMVPIDHVKQLDKEKIRAKITNGILEVTMPHLLGAQIDEDFVINID